ncbi:MAG: radical SAM protein [Candidatus Heimdallarchaeaceae archaeon]
MLKVRTWSKKNKIVGKPPLGCQLCALGSKLVIFITGKCPFNCYYCPVSTQRKADVIFANEQKIDAVEEAIDEAKQINALGASITGGEPTLKIERTLNYIQRLKEEFGKEFHIHLYTARAIPNEELEMLYSVGLDEIRFHFPQLKKSEEIEKSIKEAAKHSWKVGIEIPAIPGKNLEIEHIVEFAIKNKLDFVNLNEFEFAETNYKNLRKRDFRPVSNTQSAVKGSKELALKILKKFRKSNITLHFCSSVYKDRIQLRNRFIRRAKNYAKKHDWITKEGLIVRGRIIVDKKEDIKDILKYMKNELYVSEDMLSTEIEKKAIYTSSLIIKETAEILKNKFEDKISQIAIIEQYPMENGFITYLDPLFEKSHISTE